MYEQKTTEEEEASLVIKEESFSNDAWDALPSMSGSSAFLPYRAVTVLTNLQRGNIQTDESSLVPQQMSWHTRAAMGEITRQDVQQAVQSGELESEDGCGLTALCWAASYGQVPTVKLLLAHHSQIEHEGADGQTALQLCCSAGHLDVAKTLLTAGADPNHCDHMSCTPLMFAAAGDHASCVYELLDHGASFTSTNVAGDTAHDLACRRNSKNAVAVLERYLMKLLDT